MKTTHRIIIFLFIISIVVNVIAVREIVKYEPARYKFRHYYEWWRNGKFSKGKSLDKFNDDSTFVFLTIGQSNAAESCNKNYYAHNAVYNYRGGKLFKETKPVIGSKYVTGSVWPLLADMLIDSGYCKQVIIIPRAIGGTSSESWAYGKCHEELIKTLNDLRERSIHVTHVLWHQGEGDNGLDAEKHFNNLQSILKDIRNSGQNAPFYCSVASYSPLGPSETFGIDTLITQAQIKFINDKSSVMAGPNTDDLIYAIDRHDSWHFSKIGKEAFAKKWYNAILSRNEKYAFF